MTQHRLMVSMIAVSLAFLAPAAPAYAANEESIVLQCSGEARSRLLAFSESELEVEERQQVDRRIHIHIKNDKRATVMDHPSGEVLFAPSQCKL